MAQANPFDQFDTKTATRPASELKPLIGINPNKAEEEARAAREAQLKEEAAARASSAEQRAQAEFEGTGGRPTEAQAKASVLLTRIKGGFNDIQAVRARNPDAQEAGLGETLSRGILGEGLISRKIAGADRRIVSDAELDILDGLLTLGTGAAYTREQLEGQRASYFPQYGDSQSEIDIKNQRMARLIESAKINAGPKWAEVESAIAPFMPKASAGAAPSIQVATGKRFSTEQDFAVAEALNKLWASGATIEQMNAESQRLTGSPLSAEANDYLQKNIGNRNLPAVSPASSGNQEEPGALTETAAGLAGGLLRGGTANLAEELVNVVDPATAQKLQAALQYGAEQAPVSSFAGELVGGVVSPLSRLGGAISNPIAREAVSGAIYGGLYGAGEADPGASISDRVTNAAIGTLTGGAGGAIGGKIAERFAPNAAPEAGLTANQMEMLPAPSQLNKPRVPTKAEMDRLSTVESVPLSKARRGQDTFAWNENQAGKYAEPLIDGYGDIPVAVKLQNGEYIVFDGNHRTAVAFNAGADSMPMRVIEAKAFDPENAGRVPSKSAMSDDELLAELTSGVGSARNFDATVPGSIGEVPTPAASDMEAIVDLARKATSRAPGPGRSAARRELAALAKVNPEAAAAAERLGINLPPDVLSDNAQMLSLTGLARSQVSSEAQRAWEDTTKQAIARADNAMDEIGATTDLAQLSSDVSAKINASMEGLKQQATTLRDEVTAAFKPSDRLDAGSTKAALAKVIDELGGLDEASKAFSPEEKRLMAMLGKGEEAVQPTYAMVDRLRRQMGEALFEGKGPWVDADQAALKKFYAALADDQLAFIEQAGGKELADKQRAANSLFSEMYAKREELAELFGKDLSKSLTPLIRRAITTGAKGDAQALTKVLDNVPEELRGRVLMSGLLAESAGKGAVNGGFSFANFAKTYRGIRANAPIYKEFAKYIGPQGDQTLIDLYAISRRMVEAEAKVLKTGKANQAQLGQLNAENLLGKIAMSTGGRAATSVATGAVGGPLAAGGMQLASELAARAGGASRTDKLHRLLSSEEFRALMEKTATGETPDAAINRVAASKPFVEFAKKLPIPQTFKDRSAWIKSAFAQGGPNLSGNPEPTQ